MTTHAYLFEAKSIQGFILGTNRLKEIVGASELVERLTGSLEDDGGDSLWDHVLEATELRQWIDCSRRGAGAVYAFSDKAEKIDTLAAAWALAVQQFAPDVEFVHARGTGADHQEAFEKAHKKLLADRSRLAARLPQAGPLGRRSRRTGEPATAFARDKKGGVKEPVDAPTRRKLDFSRGGRLGRRFAPKHNWDAWPLNLSPEEQDLEINDTEAAKEGQHERDFPFIGDSRRQLAVIHADGNGLGALLQRVQEYAGNNSADYLGSFRAFSLAVTVATKRAAQEATVRVLQPHMKNGVIPARPIVLGGDDMTMIVRADLGLSFTRVFLEAFAVESGKELAKLGREFPGIHLPPQLTACAGIAYVKATQPFYLAHGLAEDLCRHAKKRAKANLQGDTAAEVPTALAFHRITTAMVERYDEILERELTASGHDTLCQTLEVYALEKGAHQLPLLGDLLALKALLEKRDFGRGATRELLGLLHADQEQAERRYRRWREVLQERDRQSPKGSRLWHDFELRMGDLLGAGHLSSDLPFSPPVDGIRRSPLGDLNTLQSIGSL